MGIELVRLSGRALRAKAISLQFWVVALMLGAAAALSGCGGDGRWTEAPSGLSYAMTSAVYEVARPIEANRPTASGGAIERYSVTPALPAGLSIDSATGVISGTPSSVSPAVIYKVTAENAGGSATARVEIEVRQTPAAPAGLTYGELSPTYTVGVALSPNAPSSSGGPITGYSIAPALPAGLSIDASTGVISGTPTASVAASDHVVTGTNLAGSTQVTLRVAVQSAPLAPASLTYAAPVALYVQSEPVVPNTAQVTGGPATAFSVSPALPAGLSLNTTTGSITGTPSALQAQATYTVTASNSIGSIQAQVRIVVTGRGSWTASAPLDTGRHYAASVKLANGKVLVVGGWLSGSVLNSAEIYDPATDTWSLAAPMLVARDEGTATLLPNGKVLVAGGAASASTSLSSAEIYDPVANTWTATGSMSEARTRHSATLLPNGKLLVIGGYVLGGISFSKTAELYDPSTGTWTAMATLLSTPRGQHAAELLPDGSAVLVIGGINLLGFQNSAELYPTNDSGTTTPVAGTVPNGNVYISARLADGDILAISDTSATAVRYSVATSSWSTSALASGSARSMATMTALADGRVLLAGGSSTASAEIYNPDVNTWTMAASMPTVRRSASANLLDNGSVLVIGGYAGSASMANVDRFAP